MSHLSSPQNLHNPTRTPSHIIQSHKHPKIKPLIYQNPTENSINEPNLRRNLKLSSKNSKAIKSIPNIYRPSSLKHIKGFFKLLKTQNSLSKFSYTFANRPIFENAYLFSKLRDLSPLTSLQLEVLGLYKFNISFKVLLKSLASLKNLMHFHVTFHGFPYKDKRIPKRFLASLRNLKKIKHLSLEFNGCYELKEDFQNILLDLKELTHLQSLQLKFSKSMVYNDYNTIKGLASVVPKLEKLTKINFDFSGGIIIQGPDVLELFQSVQTLKELSEITLNLEYTKITYETNAEPLSQGLAYLDASLIKKLKLIPHSNFDEQGFVQVAQELKRFTSLKLLDFHLSDRSLPSSQATSKVSSVLKDLVSLSSLSLSLPFLPKDALDVGSLIGPLHNLADLKLSFAGKYAGEDLPIQQLISGLRALKTLKLLHIHFPQQTSVADEAFESLAEGLIGLACLRNLSIKFASVNLLTSKKAESLSSSLKKLENLSNLCLDFGISDRIDDEAIVKIAQTLRYLPNLSSVELGLQQTPSIKDKEEIYRILFEVLKERKSLQQVTLHLTHSEFNLEEVRNLEKIKYVKTLWKYAQEF